MSYPGIIAETIAFVGHNGDRGEAYFARPTAPGSNPGVVLIHHLPGWDEWMMEQTRKLAHHGFATLCPHLYFREGPGSPDEIGARVRAAGGVPDAQVIGDAAAALAFLRSRSDSNGKVAVMGFCSGGRHAYLAGCTVPGFDAVVDCWGGNVIVDDPKQLNDKRPVAPIDLTDKLTIPLIGLFGNEDGNPTPDQVDRTEAILKSLGKPYEFHRYDGVGHAFFNYERPGFQPGPMLDGWKRVFAFLDKHIGTPRYRGGSSEGTTTRTDRA